MSKVLIDRELLEECVSVSVRAFGVGSECEERLRTILAQPAEVEGAGDWSGLRLAAEVAEEDGPWEPRLGMTNVEKAFAQSASPTKVLELIAALSAVTAERDRLREALEDLLGCPANVVQATVPKAGIEAAPPYQVVLDVSVCLTRWNKAKAAMAAKEA